MVVTMTYFEQIQNKQTDKPLSRLIGQEHQEREGRKEKEAGRGTVLEYQGVFIWAQRKL